MKRLDYPEIDAEIEKAHKEWTGTCSHGYPFTDTFTGCETDCPKCSKRGKIAGYYKARKKEEKKMRRL